MGNKLLAFFSKRTNRWSLSIMGGLLFVFMFFLVPSVYGRLSNGISPCRALDTYLYYTPDQALEVLRCFGPSRGTYLIVELSLDLIYPVVYTIFFIMVLTALLKDIKIMPGSTNVQGIHLLPLLPILAWLFDLLENLGISGMITLFPDFPQWLAMVASGCTLLKWVFVLNTIVIITVLSIGCLKKRYRS